MRKAVGSRPRPRSTQDGAFEHGNRLRMGALRSAEPNERMLEQREQAHWGKPAKSRFRR